MKVKDLEEAAHYMKVLQREYSHMQPEMRRAIDVSIEVIELDLKAMGEARA